MATLARGSGNGIRDRFGNAFTAATLGVVLAQPLGRLVQARLTNGAPTSMASSSWGFRTLLPGIRKVVTHHA